MKHTVKIKFTDLSSEEVEKLIDSLLTYNFKATIKPALKQANVSGSLPPEFINTDRGADANRHAERESLTRKYRRQ